jgi:hypothetical protein
VGSRQAPGLQVISSAIGISPTWYRGLLALLKPVDVSSRSALKLIGQVNHCRSSAGRHDKRAVNSRRTSRLEAAAPGRPIRTDIRLAKPLRENLVGEVRTCGGVPTTRQCGQNELLMHRRVGPRSFHKGFTSAINPATSPLQSVVKVFRDQRQPPAAKVATKPVPAFLKQENARSWLRRTRRRETVH